jgi:alcohol dehydrogenase YqhD (iron-dependent ADH family)
MPAWAARAFFRSVGVGTRPADYHLTPADCDVIVRRFEAQGAKLGEHQDITPSAIAAIFALAA